MWNFVRITKMWYKDKKWVPTAGWVILFGARLPQTFMLYKKTKQNTTLEKCKRTKCNKMRYACAQTRVPFWFLPSMTSNGARHRIDSKAPNTYLRTNEIMNNSSSPKAIWNTPVSWCRPDYPLFFFIPGSILKFPKAASISDGLPSGLL